jgi:hypothetical protein
MEYFLISHTIGPNFSIFQVFLICFSKCPNFSTTEKLLRIVCHLHLLYMFHRVAYSTRTCSHKTSSSVFIIQFSHIKHIILVITCNMTISTAGSLQDDILITGPLLWAITSAKTGHYAFRKLFSAILRWAGTGKTSDDVRNYRQVGCLRRDAFTLPPLRCLQFSTSWCWTATLSDMWRRVDWRLSAFRRSVMLPSAG